MDYHCDSAELGNVTEIVLPDDVPAFPLVSGDVELGVTAISGAGNESDITRFRVPFEFTALETPPPLTTAAAWEALGKRIRSLIGSPLLLAAAFILCLVLIFPSSTSRHLPVFKEICPGAIELSKDTGDPGFPVDAPIHATASGKKEPSRMNLQAKYEGGHARTREPFSAKARAPQTAKPKIALIVDDLGYDREMAASFLKLDLSLSLSVLPSAPFTDQIVQEVNKKRRELMMHLPMEPKGYPLVDPGPGALLNRMTELEIRHILEHDLEQIPGVRGVNNHMGSSFTENSGKMALILRELKRRNLFYVDSLTTCRTVGFKLAREMGVRTGKRNVFLDNELSAESITKQMERLLDLAKRSGSAIGILHPHPETLEVLRMYESRMKTEFEVVSVSDLVS